jgi:hypothetical protein
MTVEGMTDMPAQKKAIREQAHGLALRGGGRAQNGLSPLIPARSIFRTAGQ